MHCLQLTAGCSAYWMDYKTSVSGLRDFGTEYPNWDYTTAGKDKCDSAELGEGGTNLWWCNQGRYTPPQVSLVQRRIL